VTLLLARVPRSFYWLVGTFVLLLLFVAAGLHHELDRAVAATLWQDIPCWGRGAGERISVVFAAEVSLVYVLVLGAICVRSGKPMVAAWILFLLLAGIGLEITFKYYFSHPDPSSFLATVQRASCGPPGPAYPLTTVQTPSTLPSGYSIRAAYFCLLAAAMIGGRWPKLRIAAWVGLGAVALVAGATRVTVGWHWPSDVVAGLLVGAGSAVLVTGLADGFVWLGGRAVPRKRARAPARRRSSVRSR
jgi:membrane-associated phospholipid phosphatase